MDGKLSVIIATINENSDNSHHNRCYELLSDPRAPGTVPKAQGDYVTNAP